MSTDFASGLCFGIVAGYLIFRSYWIDVGARRERRQFIREQLEARKAPNVTQMPEHREGA